MKNFKNVLFLFLLLTSIFFVKGQKVVGYMDVNLSEAEARADLMNWSHMSDFIYGFITPDNNGNLPDPTGLKLFNDIKQKCLDNGVDLHFSSGGASNSGMFHTIGQNSTATANFAKEIADVMETHGMVGWDLDWEFPRTAAEQISQVNILKAVHDEFIARGKREEWHIAIAVGGETPSVGPQGVYHTDYCSADAFQYIDYLNMMSYDIGRNISGDDNHSSYEDAVNNVIDWNNKGCPISKMVLGVPFYARHKTTRGLPPGSFYDITYGNMSNDDPATYFNQDFKGDYYYNGAPTLKQKVDYIMQQGGVGVMIWEVTYDRFDEYSLLKALHDEMDKYRCDAPEPDLGDDISLCGSSFITLDGGVSPLGGLTFTWKDENGTLVNQSPSASTFSAENSGLYTLEVWKDGCNRSDDVNVTATINTPDLGGPYELCDPVSVVLDAGAIPSVHNYQWQIDDQDISGAINQSFEVKKAGTYKIVISAEGCSSVHATASVTSEVPYAESDTICNAGDEGVLEANEDVNWYELENSESVLFTGSLFSTIANENATFWMAGTGSSLTEYTTLKSTFGSGWSASVNNYGTKITVLSEMSIVGLAVKPSASGTLKLNLKESDGTTVLQTTSFTVSAGEQDVVLDWTGIAPGTYFIDAEGSSMSLIIDGTGADNDFEIPGVLTSEKTCYERWGAAYSPSVNYGFFNRLKLMAGKECKRVPVQIIIDAEAQECLTVSSSYLKDLETKIFPNPSNTFFTLTKFSGDVYMIDSKGALVKSYQNVQNNFTFGDNLENGVYFVHMKNENGISVQKVVKK